MSDKCRFLTYDSLCIIKGKEQVCHESSKDFCLIYLYYFETEYLKKENATLKQEIAELKKDNERLKQELLMQEERHELVISRLNRR